MHAILGTLKTLLLFRDYKLEQISLGVTLSSCPAGKSSSKAACQTSLGLVQKTRFGD